MMTIPSAGGLFVHVQKTAGSTVDQMLQQVFPDAEKLPGLNGRHVGLQQILNQHPHVAGYWIFGFVRNPWARMYSWYAMIERIGEALERGEERPKEQVANIALWRTVLENYSSFEEFIMKGTRDVPELRKPQVTYLRSKTRHADFVGRQETFDRDIRAVFTRLGREWTEEIPKYNANKTQTAYREVYSTAMRDQVADVFARDVDRFGYTF